jgi:hypothetical protein
MDKIIKPNFTGTYLKGKFQREIIITLKNRNHLEWRVGLSDTILKGTHPGTIYAKFGSIWPSRFRGEDIFNINFFIF